MGAENDPSPSEPTAAVSAEPLTWTFIRGDEPPFPYPAGWKRAPGDLPSTLGTPEAMLAASPRRYRIPRSLSLDAAALFGAMRDAGAAPAVCRLRAEYYDLLRAQGSDADAAYRRAVSQLAWPDLFYPSTPNRVRAEWHERIGCLCAEAAHAASYDYFGSMVSNAGEGVSYLLLDGQLDCIRSVFYQGNGLSNGMRLAGRLVLRYLCYRLDAIQPPRQDDEAAVPSLEELCAAIDCRQNGGEEDIDPNAMDWFC